MNKKLTMPHNQPSILNTLIISLGRIGFKTAFIEIFNISTNNIISVEAAKLPWYLIAILLQIAWPGRQVQYWPNAYPPIILPLKPIRYPYRIKMVKPKLNSAGSHQQLKPSSSTTLSCNRLCLPHHSLEFGGNQILQYQSRMKKQGNHSHWHSSIHWFIHECVFLWHVHQSIILKYSGIDKQMSF